MFRKLMPYLIVMACLFRTTVGVVGMWQRETRESMRPTQAAVAVVSVDVPSKVQIQTTSQSDRETNCVFLPHGTCNYLIGKTASIAPMLKATLFRGYFAFHYTDVSAPTPTEPPRV